MSARREILQLLLKYKLKWVVKMTAGQPLDKCLFAALPAELRRWCTNTGTTKCDIEMIVYLFVRVASTANLWCNKQKLIKK